MKPVHHQIVVGDCLEKMKELGDESIDSVVTDPPAGIAFMGREWDTDKGGRAQWVAWMEAVAKECLRVLKPGGHALVWGLPRTSHWTAWAWESAGFEVRDMIAHIQAQGFPKSLDVSKGIDKAAGAEREVVGVVDSRSSYDGGNRKSEGHSNEYGSITNKGGVVRTAPSTEEAKKWKGFGTGLKPSAEPWWLFRKPLNGSVVENVLEYGTGAMNIDGCRIQPSTNEPDSGAMYYKNRGLPMPANKQNYFRGKDGVVECDPIAGGRWPANVTLEHLNCVETPKGWECAEGCAVRELDAQSGFQKSGVTGKRGFSNGYGGFGAPDEAWGGYYDNGGASRFFFTAKSSKNERTAGGKVENKHPTVKPVSLMRYLCRLITPPGGLVMDPFTGSGTTGVAALQEGFQFLGFEFEADSAKTAEGRCRLALEPGLWSDPPVERNEEDEPSPEVSLESILGF